MNARPKAETRSHHGNRDEALSSRHVPRDEAQTGPDFATTTHCESLRGNVNSRTLRKVPEFPGRAAIPKTRVCCELSDIWG